MKAEIQELFTDDDLSLIIDSVKTFSQKKILPFLQNELPDGDLDEMQTVIEELYNQGIIFYPKEDSEGFETGVWGAFSDKLGPLPSSMILMEIAKSCGSTSFVVHNQGVAANIVYHLKLASDASLKKISLALQDVSGMPYVGTLKKPHKNAPARIETNATKQDGHYFLNGKKLFVYMQNDTDLLIVPALFEDKWSIFMVPTDAKGITYNNVGKRTGLRYLQLNDISFNKVQLKPESLIATNQEALDLIKRSIIINWLGISAIAVGIAQGSIDAAKQYADERYQGGSLIKNHGAIKSLFSTSYTKTRNAESIIQNFGKLNTSFTTLQKAAQIKLSILDGCSQTVTDMLQVFGGYGYMQDYRMEKRLRDIQVLKLSSGSPFFLKKFIHDSIEDK